MQLYLARHGQTAWNAERRVQGHTDVPLDDLGGRQADCLASAMSGLEIGHILSSDLSRSLETARRIAESTGAKVTVSERLRERMFGEWEGERYGDLVPASQAILNGSPSVYDICPPGGESMNGAWERVTPIADELTVSEQNALVVAHGGILALLLSQLIRGTIQTSRAFRFNNCSLTELERRSDGSFQLVRFDDSSHLTAEAELYAPAF